MNYELYQRIKKVTLREEKADLVLRNAKICDVFTGEIHLGDLAVCEGIIAGISSAYDGAEEIDLGGAYLLPGLIDAHLHLESTMVTPNEIITTAARFGTTTFIVDPHEAANVCGAAGIDYILSQTENSPANVYVMMPSCVPATSVDDNGCTFTAELMKPYLDNPRILGLGEVMNAPGVIAGDPALHEKLALFQDRPRDGHAPGLSGAELSAYALAGIGTDHEAATYAYAMEEARRGMHVHIREGSAAHNLDAIVSGIVKNHISTDCFSFCTDDKHIEDILREGHICYNVRRAIALGIPPMDAIRMATVNTARCYGLSHLGALAPGYQADLVVVSNLKRFVPERVFFKGKEISRTEAPAIIPCAPELKDTMHVKKLSEDSFRLPISGGTAHVIGLIPGQIVTEDLVKHMRDTDNYVPVNGLNKIAAVERHKETGKVGVAVCAGYGIRNGAIASSVSHDSHNIIVVGDHDRDMMLAVNAVIEAEGGYCLVENGRVTDTLPLPVMGLMSDAGYPAVKKKLRRMIKKAHAMGVSDGIDPFVTLSFLALPVIPALRITPRGLFNSVTMQLL